METTATNICIGIGLMKLQIQMFVYGQGWMKLQLQMFVKDRVDETTATNVCMGQG